MKRSDASALYDKLIAARKMGKIDKGMDQYILTLAEKFKLGGFKEKAVEVNTPAPVVRTHQAIKYKPIVTFTAW